MKPEREASIVVFWTTLLIIHGLMALALLGAIITRPLRSGGPCALGISERRGDFVRNEYEVRRANPCKD